MCVICAGVGSARPDRSELVEACKSNPDGFSWGAVVEVGDVRQLVSGRSMDSVGAFYRWAWFCNVANRGKSLHHDSWRRKNCVFTFESRARF